MLNELESNLQLLEYFSKYSKSIGFELKLNKKNKTDPPYLKRIIGNDIEIIGNIYVEVFDNRAMLNEVFNKHFHEVEKLWFKYYVKLNSVTPNFDIKDLVTIASNVSLLRDYNFNSSEKPWFRYKDNYISKASGKGIEEICEQLTQNIENYILPTFEKFNSLKKLDDFVNNPIEKAKEIIYLIGPKGIFFKKMIIAKLASNRNLVNICDAMKTAILEMENDSTYDMKRNLDVWSELNEELLSSF